MKFCQPHWDKLRGAIAARGLSALVADSGEKAASNFVSEISDGRSIDNYDPLMAAHWAIAGNAIEKVGLVLMTGDHCPICYLNDWTASWLELRDDGLWHCKCPDNCGVAMAEPPTFDWMIDRAADDQVEAWKVLHS